ncbi:replication initiation protein [Carnobacterium viridans]|uniref:Initiator Replication protein n=1 Tax=Carnobacterium viridans TaxID=174587 RepID=A0A1H0XHT2_9LACT|nr:replication initiation protein [Carnobacterium viridans]SDQ02502.1 Initiator Replication protein [Carnobacterium viridans]
MNEIVKISNQMNTLGFRNFTSKEMDLFFAICSRVREQGTQELAFSFEKLRELSSYKPTSNDRFVDDLIRTNTKLMNLNVNFDDGNEYVAFVLFPTFRINREEQTLKIAVNNEFSFLLNELTNNFARFELEQFTYLKSSYAKTMYRLLKQFKSTGFFVISIEEFRETLDIPVNYRMSEIDKKVFAPIRKELFPLYDRFEIEKVKKKGNKIVQLKFHFMEKTAPKKIKVPLHDFTK